MKKKVLQHPAVNDEWKDLFRNSSVKVGFVMSLSKAMLEMLCAVADNVSWDRSIYRTPHCPDNWIASERSLEKRGLIRRKPAKILDAESPIHLTDEQWAEGQHHEKSCCELTPAGQKVVELVKLAGLFVEQDAAVTKKFRKQRA